MGGSIFVGVRYKDRNGNIKEVLVDRWTNDMPWRFMKPSFLDQGEEFNDFIAESKPSNEWPHAKRMDKIIRSEYGIVLIDFINHEVLSRNDYFTPGINSVMNGSSAIKEKINGTLGLIEKGWVKSIEKTVWSDYGCAEINIFPSELMSEINDDITNKRSMFYHVHLSDDVFNIDDITDRYPKVKEVKTWLKKNGWTSKIDKKSFKMDD